MGFELLPIEDGDEDRYDTFTITCPAKWTPSKFADEIPPEPAFYDPLDNNPLDTDGYPALINHISQDDNIIEFYNELGVVDPDMPMMETQVMSVAAWHRTIPHEVDPERLRPYLGWRPRKVVEKTLQKTTQLARAVIRYPLRRHVKPRFPYLNVTRIDEVVSTDPLFANCRSIYHGYIGAQVFYGTKSHTIFVYGIKSKGEFPRTYRDFIRDHGAPSALRRDNAKEEQSEAVKDINREFIIKDQYTEPYHPQQNPVESNAIRYLKGQVSHLLDKTGAPDSL